MWIDLRRAVARGAAKDCPETTIFQRSCGCAERVYPPPPDSPPVPSHGCRENKHPPTFSAKKKHDSSWGIERAMRVLHGIWLRRSVFDRLQAWRKKRAAARIVRITLATALRRSAWASWRDALLRDIQIRIFRVAW